MAGRKKPTGPLVGQEALTIAKTSSGSHAYIYKGQPVPKDIPDSEVQRLLDEGFIGEAQTVEAAETTSSGSSRRSTGSRSRSAATAPADDGAGESGQDSSDSGSGESGDE